MKTSQIVSQTLAGAIAVAIAGCANGASTIPAGTNAMAQLHSLQMFSQKAAKSNANQWVTTGNGAEEYDYPAGTGPIGSISGLNSPGGECTSGKSTFWIVSGNGLVNYTYDGKNTHKTLSITAGTPGGCAVSVKNGDIAVTLLPGDGIVIFKHGKQSGEEIESGLDETYFDGYDGKNDLFVDGFNQNGSAAALVEMASGGKKFETVSLPNTVDFPGAVQWDGKYVAVLDQETSNIYRYAIAKDVATLKGTVQLSGATDCGATWIAEPYVFCAEAGTSDVDVYNYPAGGTSIATLTASASYEGLSVVQVSK